MLGCQLQGTPQTFRKLCCCCCRCLYFPAIMSCTDALNVQLISKSQISCEIPPKNMIIFEPLSGRPLVTRLSLPVTSPQLKKIFLQIPSPNLTCQILSLTPVSYPTRSNSGLLNRSRRVEVRPHKTGVHSDGGTSCVAALARQLTPPV